MIKRLTPLHELMGRDEREIALLMSYSGLCVSCTAGYDVKVIFSSWLFGSVKLIYYIAKISESLYSPLDKNLEKVLIRIVENFERKKNLTYSIVSKDDNPVPLDLLLDIKALEADPSRSEAQKRSATLSIKWTTTDRVLSQFRIAKVADGYIMEVHEYKT